MCVCVGVWGKGKSGEVLCCTASVHGSEMGCVHGSEAERQTLPMLCMCVKERMGKGRGRGQVGEGGRGGGRGEEGPEGGEGMRCVRETLGDSILSM